ncbi:perlucin-like protein [Mytilus californianus]|uniref:perlucin-like protein n=1 Tax=Mytilus californianus TaxID=6549 RepID=UPI0022452C6F|nr:perlucin-like protein [Mytilus californianus]
MEYFTFILIYLMLVNVIVVYPQKIDNFIASNHRQIETGSSIIKVRSKTECISFCIKHNDCCFANYRDSTKKCSVGTTNRCHASSIYAYGWQLLRRGRTYKNKVFFHIGDSKIWSDAQDNCGSFGMRLATVSNFNENEFLKSVTNYPFAIWFGGSDSLSEGNWRWNKPTRSINFYDWGSVLLVSQPNGWLISNCLAYFNCDPFGTQYQWVDEPCSVSYPFLCERVVRVDSDTWPIE